MVRCLIWVAAFGMAIGLLIGCGGGSDSKGDAGQDGAADGDTDGDTDGDGGIEQQLTGNPCSDNPWECDPVGVDSCDGADMGCRWTAVNKVKGFRCTGEAVVPEGGVCNRATGPHCGPGLYCYSQRCVKYCCDDGHCDETTCNYQGIWDKQITGDNLGICVETQQEGDPCSDSSPWDCDPVTNEGCTGENVACAWTTELGVKAFRCAPDATAKQGEDCTQRTDDGPYCEAGLRCFKGTCTPYCCGDSGCPDENCNYYGNWGSSVTGGNLGVCADKQESGNPCDDENNPWECNPSTNAGCGVGQTCIWAQDEFWGFFCVDGATEPEEAACSPADGLLCDGGLSCYLGVCVPFCCGGDDCGDEGCNYTGTWGGNVTGGELGVCVESQLSLDPCSELDADGGVWECDPVTNEGCEGPNSACDWTSELGVEAFRCTTDATAAEGEPCTLLSTGPKCSAGLTCLRGTCVGYCCGDLDCADSTCNYNDYYPWKNEAGTEMLVTGGSLGLCADEPPDCPASWNCVAGADCDGIAHLEYGCDQANGVCCEHPDPDAGVPEPDGSTCDEMGERFECMGVVKARLGKCAGWIRYQIPCSDTGLVCCDHAPFPIDGRTDGGVDGGDL